VPILPNLLNLASPAPPYAVHVSETKPSAPPPLEPYDPPLLPYALAGMAIWALAGLVLLLAHDWLVDTGREHWLLIVAGGLVWGVPGTLFMLRRDRRRRARAGTVDAGRETVR
jgi:hypothetical protein